MEQLERVDFVPQLELADRFDHLRRRQAELREVTAGLLPATRAARRQTRANAERRLDLDALADAVDLIELRGLLDDEDDGLAHLRREQRGLDVLLVLVAVADDDGLVVLVDRHDGEELGFAARLEAVVERPAELDDLLDDRAVLVDLDRIDAAVLALVLVLAHRVVERAAEQLDASAQDVAEPQEDRELDAACGELVDQLLHVDLAVAFTAWLDDQVALVVHGKVAASPPRDVVRVVRVGGSPPAERIGRDQSLRAGHGLIMEVR